MNCSNCHFDLKGFPIIEYESDYYCYRCAKIHLNELDQKASNEHEPISRAYNDAERMRDKWERDFRSFSLPTEVKYSIIFGAATGLTLLLSKGSPTQEAIFVFPFGVFLGWCANEYLTGRHKKDWARENPKPKSLPYPTLTLPSQKIKLFGNGEIGLQYDNNYRYVILLRDGYRCQCCGNVFPGEKLEIHHIRPRAKGGKHFDSNLITLCIDCHIKDTWFGHKHTKAGEIPKATEAIQSSGRVKYCTSALAPTERT